jgi:hypothetical protein
MIGTEPAKRGPAGRLGRGLAPVLLALLTGCRESPNPGPICTMIFAYGLSVEIRDAVTGAGIAAGAVAVARDGSYSETLEHAPIDSVAVHGAGERAGTYTITVTRPGYATWTSPPVPVTADQCHVRPVLVRAQLSPAS